MKVKINHIFYSNNKTRGRVFYNASFNLTKDHEGKILSIISRFGDPSILKKEECISSLFDNESYLFCKFKTQGSEKESERQGQIYHIVIVESDFYSKAWFDFSFIKFILDKHIKWFEHEDVVDEVNVDFSGELDLYLIELKKIIELKLNEAEFTEVSRVMAALFSGERIISIRRDCNQFDVLSIMTALLPKFLSADISISTYAYMPSLRLLNDKEIIIILDSGYLVFDSTTGTAYDLNNVDAFWKPFLRSVDKSGFIRIKNLDKPYCSFGNRISMTKKNTVTKIKSEKNYRVIIKKTVAFIFILVVVLFSYGIYVKYKSFNDVDGDSLSAISKIDDMSLIDRWGLSLFFDIDEKRDFIIQKSISDEKNRILSLPLCSIDGQDRVANFLESFGKVALSNVIDEVKKYNHNNNLCFDKKEILDGYSDLSYKTDIVSFSEKIKNYIRDDEDDEEVNKIYYATLLYKECFYYSSVLMEINRFNYYKAIYYIDLYKKDNDLKYFKDDISGLDKILMDFNEKREIPINIIIESSKSPIASSDDVIYMALIENAKHAPKYRWHKSVKLPIKAGIIYKEYINWNMGNQLFFLRDLDPESYFDGTGILDSYLIGGVRTNVSYKDHNLSVYVSYQPMPVEKECPSLDLFKKFYNKGR